MFRDRADDIDPNVDPHPVIQGAVWDAIVHDLAAIIQPAVDLFTEKAKPGQSKFLIDPALNKLDLKASKLLAEKQPPVYRLHLLSGSLSLLTEGCLSGLGKLQSPGLAELPIKLVYLDPQSLDLSSDLLPDRRRLA